ncbi:MAG TPA: VIT1/CCC1 transporter family protein [Chitinophaga sp.]|uniref:VIT1/CCC1 transporter family protein n=1 Tax=Chitinophaga sp. TaxID=1869181 RepID=UPI002DBE80C3|nr:VIT1/CCC1 transporter family protein [Chitinophaga sp.]HEU4553389.1 VIT1/CCC1 transporter family protein [Chitinophaga sp.]
MSIITIRSTGWKTDFLIGFPDGLFLLFFTTLLIQVFPVDVQQFYNLNLWVSLGGAVLVIATAWQANRGDAHDEATLSPRERKKLQKLDIAEDTIEHIGKEMEQDATRWEQVLQQEKVQRVHWHPLRALRSALVVGTSFLAGALIPFWPYLANENFGAATRTSTILVLITVLVFSFIKARITSQKTGPVIFRYLLLVIGIWLAVLAVSKVMR